MCLLLQYTLEHWRFICIYKMDTPASVAHTTSEKHSSANFTAAKTTHLSLDVAIDFDRQCIVGTVIIRY